MSTKEMPRAEVANMVNHIVNCEFGEDWQFGKEPYSRDNPPPVVSRVPLLFCLLCSRLRLLTLVGFFLARIPLCSLQPAP